MKTLARWLAIPATMALSLSVADIALSQLIAITPSSSTVQVKGTSGGTQADASCAKHIAGSPNHVIQVTEDTNLRFSLQAVGGEPALLIRSATGQDYCVPADSDSGGKVTIPGRWSKGNYSVFVGDRANGQFPYTLSISRN